MNISEQERANLRVQFATDRSELPLPFFCQQLGVDPQVSYRIRTTLARGGINLLDSLSVRYGQACIAEVYWMLEDTVNERYLEHFFFEFELEYPRIFQEASNKAFLVDQVGMWVRNEQIMLNIIGIWDEAMREMMEIMKEKITRYFS